MIVNVFTSYSKLAVGSNLSILEDIPLQKLCKSSERSRVTKNEDTDPTCDFTPNSKFNFEVFTSSIF